MTLPAAYQASLCQPEACGFFVLCPRFLAPLWEACPWVDMVLEMKGKHLAGPEVNSVRGLFAGVALVFPNSFGSAMDAYRSRIPNRVGRSGRFRSFLLTHRLPEWPRSKGEASFHQLSYYLDLAASLGKIEYSAEYPRLNVDLGLAAKHGISGQGWLALAPGAAFGPAKQWPPEHFLKIAQWQISRGGRVVFVGTGKEAPVTSELCKSIPHSIDLAGKTNLAELMAVLAASESVVANDSGAMHLAAAVGTSGVAVFGSTDPIATGPIGAPWRYIASPAPCRPCFQRECPRQDTPYTCLRGIMPEEVIAELKELTAGASNVS